MCQAVLKVTSAWHYNYYSCAFDHPGHGRTGLGGNNHMNVKCEVSGAGRRAGPLTGNEKGWWECCGDSGEGAGATRECRCRSVEQQVYILPSLGQK